MTHPDGKGPRSNVKKTVLVVEDDFDLLHEMMEFFTNELGYEVRGAYDFAGAVVQLAACKPDIVTIDLTLPRESGYELCEYIRALPNHADVPILVTGEAACAEKMAHAEQAGANIFLEKPFSMRDLDRNVSALLDKPKVSRSGLWLLRLF